MVRTTFSAKPSDVDRKWYLIDASKTTLGRIATLSASLLLGKGKPSFTHHIDVGDYVVIINAENILVTGDKLDKKIYYRHSGFPGGIKAETLSEKLEKDATEPLFKAIRGMLPVNKLRDDRLKRLKIYAGPEHGHEAQKPTMYKVEGDK